MKYTLFSGVRLPDHTITHLLCENGTILRAAPDLHLSREEAALTETVRCRAAQAIPTLCDLHAHPGEQGFAYRETLRESAASAQAGGFDLVCAVQEESSRIDDATELIPLLQSVKTPCHFLPTVSAFTENGACQDYAALRELGAVAFADHRGSADTEQLYTAMRELAKIDALLLLTCREPSLAVGVLQEGRTADYLHQKGIPAAAETVAVARALALAEETGCRVHLQTISAAGSFRVIREAKSRGVPVTCEISPLYGFFTDDAVFLRGTSALLDPPLRTKRDVDALLSAVADGTVDAIVSDHSPRGKSEKALPLEQALPGSCGLETAFATAYTCLVASGVISLPRLIELMRDTPRRILGIAPTPPPFTEGAAADFTLLSSQERVVDPTHFRGKAQNTPLAGTFLSGMTETIVRAGIPL